MGFNKKNMDKNIAVATMASLLFIGIITVIIQVINYSYTNNTAILSVFIIEPNVPISVSVLILVAVFIVPAISALTAALKPSMMVRIVHLVIVSIATTGLLAVLCQEMWTLSNVGTSFTCQDAASESINSISVCNARDTRITNFVMMLCGMVVLVVNLIFTGIVFCFSRQPQAGNSDGN